MARALIPRTRDSMSAMTTNVTPRSPRGADLKTIRVLGLIPRLLLVHLIPSESAVCRFLDLHVALEPPGPRLSGGKQGRRITRLHQLGGYEDEKLGTPLARVLGTEELAQDGYIAQEGNLGRIVRQRIVHQAGNGQVLAVLHFDF